MIAFTTTDNHTPGGKDHDQKRHGRKRAGKKTKLIGDVEVSKTPGAEKTGFIQGDEVWFFTSGNDEHIKLFETLAAEVEDPETVADWHYDDAIMWGMRNDFITFRDMEDVVLVRVPDLRFDTIEKLFPLTDHFDTVETLIDVNPRAQVFGHHADKTVTLPNLSERQLFRFINKYVRNSTTDNHTPGGQEHDQSKHGRKGRSQAHLADTMRILEHQSKKHGKLRDSGKKGRVASLDSKGRPRKLFHGSKDPSIDAFSMGHTVMDAMGEGVNFTESLLEASFYGPYVYEVSVDWDKADKDSYNSVKASDYHHWWLVRDPKVISIKKVHRAKEMISRRNDLLDKIGLRIKGEAQYVVGTPEFEEFLQNHTPGGHEHDQSKHGRKGKGFGKGRDVSKERDAILKERKKLQDQEQDLKANAEFIQDQMQDAYEKFLETNDADDWMESKERSDWNGRYNDSWREYWKVRDQIEKFDKQLMMLPIEHIPTLEEYTGKAKDDGYFPNNMSYKEAVEELGEDEVTRIFAEHRSKRDEWRARMKHEISMGHISQEQAEAKGWNTTGGEKYTEMPTDLWHVTTAAGAIERDGVLKTRDELKISEGPGLGGGASDTISYTADEQIATQIYGAMKEGRAVAAGELTVPDMIKAAEEGKGTEGKPYIERLMHHWDRDWKTGDELPDGVQQTIEGRRRKWSTLKMKYVEARSATQQEQLDDRWEFFKRFAFTREQEGGPMDPLFFSTDTAKLAATKPEDIQIIRLRSKEGAQGYQVSALGEWRSHTGDNVEVVKVGTRPIKKRMVKNMIATTPSFCHCDGACDKCKNKTPFMLNAKGKGVWRTIRGSRVFIEDGKITKGPAKLRGKSASEAKEGGSTSKGEKNLKFAVEEMAMDNGVPLRKVKMPKASKKVLEQAARLNEDELIELAAGDRDIAEDIIKGKKAQDLDRYLEDLFESFGTLNSGKTMTTKVEFQVTNHYPGGKDHDQSEHGKARRGKKKQKRTGVGKRGVQQSIDEGIAKFQKSKRTRKKTETVGRVKFQKPSMISQFKTALRAAVDVGDDVMKAIDDIIMNEETHNHNPGGQDHDQSKHGRKRGGKSAPRPKPNQRKQAAKEVKSF